ncbi:MAG: hypothetical protein Q9178_001621 [Gyalolechia marmorata]
MSRNSSTSPAHLRMSENMFTLTPDTPVNRNATSRAIDAADPMALPTGPSLTHRPYALGRSPTEGPRATAYPQANYSAGSLFDNSPLYQASSEFEEERTSAQSSTTRFEDPPKAPEYPFRPHQLEVANPDYDPEFEGAIFDSTKAVPHPIESNQPTEGYISDANSASYEADVDKQFVQARKTLPEITQENGYLERRHAQQKDAWQNELNRAQIATTRWSQPLREVIKKPRLIGDQEIEIEAHQVDSNGDTEFVRGNLLYSGSQRYQPLYDSFPARLRQMAVELLLQRSNIADILRDWKAMENCSRQAYDLAVYFKWKPYHARCAFSIGKALYQQKDWMGAYEKFEEAEKTEGYYIARRDILHWLSETSQRLEEFPEPWSTTLSAARGENPPSLTPLNTVVEEGENVSFPDSGDQYSAAKEGASSNALLPTNKQTIHATDSTLQANDPDAKRGTTSDYIGRGDNAETGVVAASPNDRILRLKSHPKAITLPSVVEPPRIRTPRIYEPQPSNNFSMAQNDDLSSQELRSSEATSLGFEMFVNAYRKDETTGEDDHSASPLNQAASSEDVPGQGHQQPESLGSRSPTLIAKSINGSGSSQTANDSNEQSDNDDSPASYRSDVLIGSENLASPLSANATNSSPTRATDPNPLASPTQTPAPNSSSHPPQNSPLPPTKAPPLPLSPTNLQQQQQLQQRKNTLLARRREEEDQINAVIRTVLAGGVAKTFRPEREGGDADSTQPKSTEH